MKGLEIQEATDNLKKLEPNGESNCKGILPLYLFW
jgi:hypothetical protein